MHEFGKICSVKGVLPKSCTLSAGSLPHPGFLPVSENAYEGILNGLKVRIKRVRIVPKGDPQKAKVCSQCHVSPFLGANEWTDIPPSRRGVETPGTSKHCSPSGRDHRSTSTSFGLDVRWGLDGIHYEPSGCRQTVSRACAFYRVMRCPYPLTSYPMSPKASITSTPAT